MSPDNHRHERVGEEIAHEINVMLAGELKDPRLEVSVIVSEVRVQPDMKHARVFVSVPHTYQQRAGRCHQSSRTRFWIHSPGTRGAAAIAARPGSALYAGPLSGARRAHRTAPQGSEERETGELGLTVRDYGRLVPPELIQVTLQKKPATPEVARIVPITDS